MRHTFDSNRGRVALTLVSQPYEGDVIEVSPGCLIASSNWILVVSYETQFVDTIRVGEAHATRFASAVGKCFLGGDDRAVSLPKVYFTPE